MTQKLNTNTENKKAHAINMKCYKKIKTHTFFLEDLRLNDVKMEVFREIHGEFEKVSGKEEDEQLEMFEGKLKRFKN